MLNNIKLYRQLRGGIWVKYRERNDMNITTFWKKYRYPSSAIIDVNGFIEKDIFSVNFEVYGNYEKDTSFANLIIGLQKRIYGTDITNKVNDGYHSFDELYMHRNLLFVALLNAMATSDNDVWKAAKDNDGSIVFGYFVAGYKDQITYHLPLNMWDMLNVPHIDKGKWDGHTSDDVLKRLKTLGKWEGYRMYIEKEYANLKKGTHFKITLGNGNILEGFVEKQIGDTVYFHIPESNDLHSIHISKIKDYVEPFHDIVTIDSVGYYKHKEVSSTE